MLISDNNLDSSNKYFDTDSVPISWFRRIIHVLVCFGLTFFLWQAKQISLMKSWRIQNQPLEPSSIEKYNIKGKFDNNF